MDGATMMQKYISNSNDVRYFEDDVKVSDWIDLDQYRLMTDIEILKHETNPNTNYHTWNGSEWLDNRTAEEIADYERSNMPTLKPMDFDLKLNKFGLYQQVQDLIKTDIELSIAYNRALYFRRTDKFIEQARLALNLTHEKIDEMWMS